MRFKGLLPKTKSDIGGPERVGAWAPTKSLALLWFREANAVEEDFRC